MSDEDSTDGLDAGSVSAMYLETLRLRVKCMLVGLSDMTGSGGLPPAVFRWVSTGSWDGLREAGYRWFPEGVPEPAPKGAPDPFAHGRSVLPGQVPSVGPWAGLGIASTGTLAKRVRRCSRRSPASAPRPSTTSARSSARGPPGLRRNAAGKSKSASWLPSGRARSGSGPGSAGWRNSLVCGTKPGPKATSESPARASHRRDSGRGRTCHRRDSAAAHVCAPAFARGRTWGVAGCQGPDRPAAEGAVRAASPEGPAGPM